MAGRVGIITLVGIKGICIIGGIVSITVGTIVGIMCKVVGIIGGITHITVGAPSRYDRYYSGHNSM